MNAFEEAMQMTTNLCFGFKYDIVSDEVESFCNYAQALQLVLTCFVFITDSHAAIASCRCGEFSDELSRVLGLVPASVCRCEHNQALMDGNGVPARTKTALALVLSCTGP